MKFVYLLACVLFLSNLSAQTTVGLFAYYRFDGDLADATGRTANAGIESGIIDYGCGANGSSLRLNGANDFVRIPGGTSANVNGEFDTEDFTLSFYFKPVGMNGMQYLVSKRDTNCMAENYFYIRYQPLSRTVTAYLQNGAQQVTLSQQLTNRYCWQQLTLVRRDLRVRLYLNGELAGDLGTTSRLDLTSTGDLLIGGANCRTASETTFDGLLDEFRVYTRALSEEEVRGLYTAPDQIATPDARIFLGESVDITLTATCGTAFAWTPEGGVVAANEAEPTITPDAPGTQIYRVRISDDESSCIAEDSIEIQVINPSDLDCEQVFLPKAFTPNGQGPAENETFGISNPYAVPELIVFEIYDRWGGRIFQTNDPQVRWDGSFRGQPINPGVLLYRVRYRCNGEDKSVTGSVTVLR